MTGLINYKKKKKIIIVCGHYGAGKTNISVNLSIEIKKQTGFVYTLADLDTVNPYFRSADNTEDLKNHGIDFILPPFANSNVDIPSVPARLYSVFEDGKRAVLDVGGDETGAMVLGMFAGLIKRGNYEMIYVINKYRKQTSDPQTAANLADFIEKSSKLKITSVLNNSNIGNLTTKKEIYDSMDYAKKTADLLNVPLIATTSMIDVDFDKKTEYNIFQIKNYTKRLF
jgi:MinD-like ATPase involved in chromosome partitioning or flagellar assembly